MEISLKVFNPHWEVVYNIPKGTSLQKGRHGLYHDLVNAAGNVTVRFGCYSWGHADEIFYIGSFSKDYKHGNHKSNLAGRVHNYLQNHRTKETGQKNTNLMVFERINEGLAIRDITLKLFQFDFLELGLQRVEYASYIIDTDLVRALEQLLICSYKNIDQCRWNRE
ncbi:MAG: hypothetical protein HS100_16110 [Anaerolineales bacterium]|nr:hypothetical protein [Anaerolineales bacterium]